MTDLDQIVRLSKDLDRCEDEMAKLQEERDEARKVASKLHREGKDCWGCDLCQSWACAVCKYRTLINSWEE